MDFAQTTSSDGVLCFAAGAAANAIRGSIALRDAQAAAHAADGAARAGGGPAITAAVGLADSLRLAAGLVTACGDRLPVVAAVALSSDEADVALPALRTASRTLLDLRDGSAMGDLAQLLATRSPVVVVTADSESLATAVEGAASAIADWSHAAAVAAFDDAESESATAALPALRDSKRPVILVGRGAAVGSDPVAIARLAKTWQAPVCLTFSATGMPASVLGRFLAAFSADVPVLPAGTVPWSTALARADRILALGSGVAETDWFGLTEARLVRTPVTLVALEPESEGVAETIVNCEAGSFSMALVEELERGGALTADGWSERFIEARAKWTELVDDEAQRGVGDEVLSAALVARQIVSAAPAETVFVGEGGASGMWLASYAWLRPIAMPAQHASIGASIGMAVGIAAAEPQRPVWAVVGDGAFFYCARELATLTERGAPVVVFVFNDRSWNAIRLVQTLFFRRRTVGTDLPSVNYRDMADLHGAESIRVKTAGDLAKALSMAQEPRTRPLVVDVRIEKGAIPFVGANLILAEVDGVLRSLSGAAAVSSGVAAAKDRPALLANLRVIRGAVRK